MSPHSPKAMKAGPKLGMRLRRPNFKLRNAKIKMKEINTSAPNDAPNMDSMFRFEIYAQIRESPEPDVWTYLLRVWSTSPVLVSQGQGLPWCWGF